MAATYPTTAQIDTAVPTNGDSPLCSNVNSILKGALQAPDFSQIGSVPAALTAAQAAGTASIRAIGTGATQAAAGNHTHAAASGTANGFMTSAQFTKLANMIPFTLTATKPESMDSPGTQWQVFVESEALYLCIAENTWRKLSLTGWGD